MVALSRAMIRDIKSEVQSAGVYHMSQVVHFLEKEGALFVLREACS